MISCNNQNSETNSSQNKPSEFNNNKTSDIRSLSCNCQWCQDSHWDCNCSKCKNKVFQAEVEVHFDMNKDDKTYDQVMMNAASDSSSDFTLKSKN